MAQKNDRTSFLDWLEPSAQAQPITIAQADSEQKFEYSVAKVFDNKGILVGAIETFPLHSLELKPDAEGARLTGTSPVALQVLVFPSGKYSDNLKSDAFKNGGTLESDILYEKLILPNDSINEVIKLKTGDWKVGKYDIVMSPGAKFARNGTYPYGAFGYNVTKQIVNIITMVDGVISIKNALGTTDSTPVAQIKSREVISKIALKLPPVLQSCHRAIEFPKQEDKDKDIWTKLTGCLQEPDNLRTIGNLFGIGEDKLVTGVLKIEASQNASLYKQIGDFANGAFASFDLFNAISDAFIIRAC